MDPARRPFFTADEDDECAFMGTGVSSNSTLAHQNPFSSRPTRGSHRNIQYIGSPVSSPRSGRFYYDPRFEDPRAHFLESCALCKRRLGNHRDIFMYRGDTAFCSEDCRQEQIDMDEAKQKNQNISSLRKKDQGKSSTTSPSKSEDCPFRTGTVAAA